jgi:hypothetical protein
VVVGDIEAKHGGSGMSLHVVLYIVAFVCFVAAAIGVSAGRLSLLAVGLAAWVLVNIV